MFRAIVGNVRAVETRREIEFGSTRAPLQSKIANDCWAMTCADGKPVERCFTGKVGVNEVGVMSEDIKQITILTVDDHPLLREGIAALVADATDMILVGEATNGREAIHQFRAHRPDITLMDLQMPEMNGLDATIAIRGEFPDARIIVLTTYAGDVQARRALQAGARAYLLKNGLHKELLETIRAVHAGRKNLSPEVSFELAEHAAEEGLSPLEVRILRLIAQGNSNKAIAASLSVTEDSVKGHVRNILGKLGANDRTHAAMIGVKRGIIEI